MNQTWLVHMKGREYWIHLIDKNDWICFDLMGARVTVMIAGESE